MSLVRLTSFPATTFNRVFSFIYRSPKNYTFCSHRVLYNRVLVSRKLSQKAEVIGPEGTIKTHIDGSRPKFVVTYDELNSQIFKGTVQLFDVRSGDDVESTGRIPGSVNIPQIWCVKAENERQQYNILWFVGCVISKCL
ncbi:unnamed protein product [Schistosoma spindalis]|nr:unnamed protein product [Schistosoma spindale]